MSHTESFSDFVVGSSQQRIPLALGNWWIRSEDNFFSQQEWLLAIQNNVQRKIYVLFIKKTGFPESKVTTTLWRWVAIGQCESAEKGNWTLFIFFVKLRQRGKRWSQLGPDEVSKVATLAHLAVFWPLVSIYCGIPKICNCAQYIEEYTIQISKQATGIWNYFVRNIPF